MSDEKALLEEVEMAGMWYQRKLTAVGKAHDEAWSQCRRGYSSTEKLVSAVEALVAAEKRLTTAFNNAIPTCYRSQVEVAQRKGMNP